MQVTLTSYNDIKARHTTATIESGPITAKAGNGVIIEKWLQRSRVRTKNKASRAVSMDISLGTARSTSSSESVTPQASVHFKRALLYVNEMRFTADRRSIRRYPLEKGLYMM